MAAPLSRFPCSPTRSQLVGDASSIWPIDLPVCDLSLPPSIAPLCTLSTAALCTTAESVRDVREPSFARAAESVVVLGPLGLPAPLLRSLPALGQDGGAGTLAPRGLERKLGQFGRRGSMPLSLPVSTLSEGLAKAPRLRTMSITGQLTGGGGGAALATSPLQPRGCGSSSRRQSFVWDADFEFSRTEGTGVSACEEAGYVFGAHEHGVRGKAGTPGFWAPEMLFYERDGKGRRYGPAVDYWSLGCLVYALLAARGPFTIIGGDTSDDNAATLNSDPDLSLPEFSAAATSLMRVGVSPVESVCVCVCTTLCQTRARMQTRHAH